MTNAYKDFTSGLAISNGGKIAAHEDCCCGGTWEAGEGCCGDDCTDGRPAELEVTIADVDSCPDYCEGVGCCARCGELTNCEASGINGTYILDFISSSSTVCVWQWTAKVPCYDDWYYRVQVDIYTDTYYDADIKRRIHVVGWAYGSLSSAGFRGYSDQAVNDDDCSICDLLPFTCDNIQACIQGTNDFPTSAVCIALGSPACEGKPNSCPVCGENGTANVSIV